MNNIINIFGEAINKIPRRNRIHVLNKIFNTIPVMSLETADDCTVLLETNTDLESLAVPEKNIRRQKNYRTRVKFKKKICSRSLELVT